MGYTGLSLPTLSKYLKFSIEQKKLRYDRYVTTGVTDIMDSASDASPSESYVTRQTTTRHCYNNS